MNDERNEMMLIWEATPTPEVDAEVQRLEDELDEYETCVDLSELEFLAFSAGYKAAQRQLARA
jgi:hypothetical protein